MAAVEGTTTDPAWDYFTQAMKAEIGAGYDEAFILDSENNGRVLGQSLKDSIASRDELSRMSSTVTDDGNGVVKWHGKHYVCVRTDKEQVPMHTFFSWTPKLHLTFSPESRKDAMTTLLLWHRGCLPVSRDVLLNVLIPAVAGMVADKEYLIEKRQKLFKRKQGTILLLSSRRLVLVLTRTSEGSRYLDLANLHRFNAWCDYLIAGGF